MKPFIMINRSMLKSDVFRGLSSTAKTVYFDFRMRCRIKTMKRGGEQIELILNNGQLEYCYSEAERKGIPRSTFMRVIGELVEKGFLDIEHSGSGGVKGDKSLYAISYRWMKYGTPDFEHSERPKDTRQGRGFRKGNMEWMKGRRTNIGVKNDTQALPKMAIHQDLKGAS